MSKKTLRFPVIFDIINDNKEDCFAVVSLIKYINVKHIIINL